MANFLAISWPISPRTPHPVGRYSLELHVDGSCVRNGRHVDVVEGGVHEDRQPDDEHHGKGYEAHPQDQLPYGAHLLVRLAAHTIVHVPAQIQGRADKEAPAQAQRIQAEDHEAQQEVHGDGVAGSGKLQLNPPATKRQLSKLNTPCFLCFSIRYQRCCCPAARLTD